MLSFHNTLGKKKEEFVPLIPGKVGMYNCGPTVYDYVHIGNLRALIFADILRRTLERNGYDVNQVMNITDVGHLTSDADAGEDKMMKGLKREGLPFTLEGMRELADRYIDAFMKDLEAVNVIVPTTMPRASDHINEQIELIKRLEAKGLTYSTSDGLYFSTKDYPEYGKLGGISESEAGDEHTRIVENIEKRDQRDFALWKFNNELGWESPWGKGFPGWHIECSAMSMKYLGESFDIHTGGIEHVAVHHNDEIAQAEAATEKPFSRFWMHNDHVQVSGRKMAKSEGTGFTRKDLEERGITPLSYRYFVLTAHYRSQLNFTWEAVEGAQAALDRLRARLAELPDGGAINEGYKNRFDEALNDDLGTPQALAIVWEALKDASLSDADKKTTILSFDDALGLKLDEVVTFEIPTEVSELAEKREAARLAKDWATSDTLRKELQDLGFDVEDTDKGPRIVKR
jgi:cysteinyl-tRNA synthetase